MHFERYVQGDTTDVRSRSYYIYKCNLCGHVKDFDWVSNFQTRLRKCPKCKVEDDTNDKEYLINRKQQLEQSIQELLLQIQTDRAELEQVTAKLEVFLQPQATAEEIKS